MDVETERTLLRVEEAAWRLGISRSKLYQLIAAGEIPTVRYGRTLRVHRSRLLESVDKAAAIGKRSPKRRV